MSIKTPADLVDQFKKSGKFDALRNQLLDDFKSSPSIDAFTSEVDGIARGRLSTDSKLQFMSADDVQRELLSELDCFPAVSQVASNSQSLADPALMSQIRNGVVELLQADRGGPLMLEDPPTPSVDVDMNAPLDSALAPGPESPSRAREPQPSGTKPSGGTPSSTSVTTSPSRASEMPTTVRVASGLPTIPLGAGLPPRPVPYRAPSRSRSRSPDSRRRPAWSHDKRKVDVWIPSERGRRRRSRERQWESSSGGGGGYGKSWRESRSRDGRRSVGRSSDDSRSPDRYRARRRSHSYSRSPSPRYKGGYDERSRSHSRSRSRRRSYSPTGSRSRSKSASRGHRQRSRSPVKGEDGYRDDRGIQLDEQSSAKSGDASPLKVEDAGVPMEM